MVDDPNFETNFAEGVGKFQGARSKAFWSDVSRLVRGKPIELLSFDEIRQKLGLREELYRGIQEIPLDRIVGSVGRYRDFTRTFLPKSNELKERWSRIYAKATGFTGLPPIDVYQVGSLYFVRDGNHRVSVAHEMKAETIEAHVTELPTSVDLHLNEDMSDEEIDDALSYARFLNQIGLPRVRPEHESLKLSEPSRYPDLLGQIYLHTRVREIEQEQEIKFMDGAADWYDTIYLPAIELIRKYDLLDLIKSKDRTEADVYVWLTNHLRYVREQFGEGSRSRRFSDAMVDFLAEHEIAIPRNLLHEQDGDVSFTSTRAMEIAKEEAKPTPDEE